ncbi:LL-diaminopimelate aminotransferase [Dethiobacter alkaliphilus]|uniref:LL-diaminopimelate aminotransferase n=1 Tax=Dethiobacter alkaliphilus TaxID=427926 RepID=UPI0023EED947|nr:LL-diaminopimelate aminotransferase [Dethiobacter alkaliphilus]
MHIQPADRINKLPRYLFAEIDKKIRAAVEKGVDVIKLGIGDPDQPTPDYIVKRAIEEVQKPANHTYPPDEGLTEFKEAVAAYYKERHNVELDPEKEVCVLLGSKEGIAHISACFVNPGDLNLVPDPGYPVYSIGTMFAGGDVYRMPLLAENNFLPDFSAVDKEVAKKAKLMFLNYPNNPTGAEAPPEFFAQAAQFAKENNIIICHDQAYSEIAYDGYKPMSFLEAPGAKEVGIEFGSLSKTFNMTGWRLAYAVGRAEVVEVLSRYKTNIDSGTFKAIQYTGVEAFRNPAKDEFQAEISKMYQERRDVVVNALKEMGIDVRAPKATFYVWAPVPEGFADSTEFVSYILEETGVVVTPGRGFGEHGEGYFRIALTVDAERMAEAMRRIKDALAAGRP